MKVNELSVTVRPSKHFNGYRTVDIVIKADGVVGEANELLKDSDIESRLDEMFWIAKEAILERLRDEL